MAYYCLVLGLPPSPSLEFVHASAGLSRRFVSWLRRAAKNYGDLLELEAVADNRLREERVEELTGAEKTRLTEAIMEYEKILADLSRIYKSPAMETFCITGEGLIKWVGDEAISLGYTGMRERSAQYWLWDAKTDSRAEEIPLPFKKKMRNVLEFYHVETYDAFHVPSQEEAERELLDFLENVKKWPRERLVYIVKNRYPLNDDTGGFWSVTQHIVQLQSLRDLWEEFMNNWKRTVEDELMKTPEFGNLKTVISQWEAEHHVADIVDEAQKELMVKYAERIADPADVKNEFLARAKAIFLERVIPETKMGEVYEQIKVAVPTEKVELTKAGLRKAIRWAFLHPEMSLDAFASGQVFPLDFTTEQAREIAAKIFEKVPKKPPVVAPPPPPPSIRAYWGTSPRGLPALWVEVYVEGKLKVRGHLEVRRETRETLERIINVKIKDSIVEAGLPEDMLLVDPLLKQNVELTKTLLETAPPEILVPPVRLTAEESARLADVFIGMLRTAGVPLPTQYKSEFEKAMDINKTYEENLPLIKKAAEDILKGLMPDLELEQKWSTSTPSTRKSMLVGSKIYPYADIDITVNKNWNALTDTEKRAIKIAWRALQDIERLKSDMTKIGEEALAELEAL